MDSFNWKEEAKDQWDNRASFWNSRSQSMWEHGSRKDIISFIKQHIISGHRVLDVGCGDGYGSYRLQQAGYEVTGVDLSPKMIVKAKEQFNDIEFFQADVGELPFESKSYDGIMTINVLEWTEIPAMALKELSRVLKDDGLLCAGILGPTAGPRSTSYPKVYGKETISNSMMPWEFQKLASDLNFEYIDGFGVYKKGVTNSHTNGLSTELQQALSFMWVFMLKKVSGEKDGS
ncbi:class I SAM-dependent methyltransferase [Ornithinibacillus halophilus]|uniref:Methyltransferase domain-containing protein n=1 Tax=Ornithinibacillus halophilus TaxID=930117 RepID=A0A1M5GYS7_9BACI|nr:class I SAM-dependent methyltransferase [Ornithinibacillus halophilus]SHG08765.1 Methyltransferase domain-containing protein [Ornithinibacillus halophilus]